MKKQSEKKVQYIETPRGRFVLEDMTHSDAQLQGYFFHHGFEGYDIMSNGESAFAIPKIEIVKSSSHTSLVPMKEPEKPVDPAILASRLDASTLRIRKELGSVAKSFVKIGFELWKIRDEKLYSAQGFKNVYQYGESVFGLKKTSVAMYVSVCERFSVHKLDKPTAVLMPEFSSFSYGQLQLMANLSDDEIKNISADTTCKEIREMKKFFSGKVDPNGREEEPLSDEEEADSNIFVEFTPVEIWNRVLTDSNYADLLKILKDNIGKNVIVRL